MKKKTLALIAVLVVAVAALLLITGCTKDKWPPKTVFGTIVDPGMRYEFIYGSNLASSYQMGRSDSMGSVCIFEDLINDLVEKIETGNAFSEKIFNKYNQKYDPRGNEELLQDLTKDYDLKVVNAEAANEKTSIRYKLYIKGNSWCIVDQSGDVVAGMENYYGTALMSVIQEMRSMDSNGTTPHKLSVPGTAVLEGN